MNPKYDFKVHDYKVVCKCGHSSNNCDDGVIDSVKLVKVAFCESCTHSNVFPAQLFYDSEGKRIYT